MDFNTQRKCLQELKYMRLKIDLYYLVMVNIRKISFDYNCFLLLKIIFKQFVNYFYYYFVKFVNLLSRMLRLTWNVFYHLKKCYQELKILSDYKLTYTTTKNIKSYEKKFFFYAKTKITNFPLKLYKHSARNPMKTKWNLIEP